MATSSGFPPRPDYPPAPACPPRKPHHNKVIDPGRATVNGFKALPGDRVLLAGEFPAHVDYVAVYPNGRKRYSVVWWNNGERKSDYVDDLEFTVIGADK